MSIPCFIFSFAMITLLVRVNGGIPGDRYDGGDATA